MRRASTFLSRQSFMELKMTSMIDVVFLLLIFFVWNASFQIAEYVLPSQVSEAKQPSSAGNANTPPPPEADFTDIVVRLMWSSGRAAWSVNDIPLETLDEVRQRLAMVFVVNRAAPVIIHPDPDAPLGQVIDLYDLARQIGFAKVQFAAGA